MSDGIRLVRDLLDGTVHRTDCPALLPLSPVELAPFEGLERTLAGEAWQGRFGRSSRCIRWCLCVTSAVTAALAEKHDEAFAGRRGQQPRAHAELVDTMRQLAEQHEARLKQYEMRLAEQFADDASKPIH